MLVSQSVNTALSVDQLLISQSGNTVLSVGKLLVTQSDTLPCHWHAEAAHQFSGHAIDWGFTSFANQDEVLAANNGFLVNDTLRLNVVVRVDRPEDLHYDSKQSTGYVGLKNQGATCYMNSLLQTLYNINYFRQVLFAFFCKSKACMQHKGQVSSPDACCIEPTTWNFAKMQFRLESRITAALFCSCQVALTCFRGIGDSFMQAVYHMPTQEEEMPATSIPLALQSTFYKVMLLIVQLNCKVLCTAVALIALSAE